MEQLRMVDTPHGPVTYILEKKRVKNLNLRVGRDGQAALSVPLRCTAERADEFVREKAEWILKWQGRQRAPAPELLPPPEGEECRRLLEEAVRRVYPLVSPLGVAMPPVRLRRMKSQWGNCHWRQGFITLNTVLARCPEHLRDYVALHELVHFLHHGHGPGFYARMDSLMPRWREHRRELKGYAAALAEGKNPGPEPCAR